MVHPLKICSPLNNNEAPILGHSKIQKTMSEDERKRLFADIFKTFLSEDSDNVLPLSNQALWADLLATFNALQSKEPVTTESLNKLLQVRKDPGIWDDGLEPTYMRFLKQAPPPTLAACLLSILWNSDMMRSEQWCKFAWNIFVKERLVISYYYCCSAQPTLFWWKDDVSSV